jgi:F-type H+-transporting ATPase subunit c
MRKFKYTFLTVLALMMLAGAAMAQGAADNQSTVDAYKALGTGIGVLGFGLVAGLAGIGQGLVGSRAAEGAARNPGAAGTVQTLMIIALALIESLVLFGFVVVLLKI